MRSLRCVRRRAVALATSRGCSPQRENNNVCLVSRPLLRSRSGLLPTEQLQLSCNTSRRCSAISTCACRDCCQVHATRNKNFGANCAFGHHIGGKVLGGSAFILYRCHAYAMPGITTARWHGGGLLHRRRRPLPQHPRPVPPAAAPSPAASSPAAAAARSPRAAPACPPSPAEGSELYASCVMFRPARAVPACPPSPAAGKSCA